MAKEKISKSKLARDLLYYLYKIGAEIDKSSKEFIKLSNRSKNPLMKKHNLMMSKRSLSMKFPYILGKMGIKSKTQIKSAYRSLHSLEKYGYVKIFPIKENRKGNHFENIIITKKGKELINS